MSPFRLSSLCWVYFFCLASLAEAQQLAVPGVLPSEIRGTVRINGLITDGSQITIQAVPMGVRSSNGKRFDPDPRARVRTATLVSTADPHVFSFEVMGLQPATLYRLGIDVPPSPISPRIFWRGPMQGLALSGGPPVAIDGFAARTEVEILDSAGNWVGADDLQFTSAETGSRTLRWRSRTEWRRWSRES